MGKKLGVTDVISEMFQGTHELMETEELSKFVIEFWKTASRLRRHRFVDFLGSVCSDEDGRPLDSNQMDVITAMRSTDRDVWGNMFNDTLANSKITVVEDTGEHAAGSWNDYRYGLSLVSLAARTCAGHMQEGLKLWLTEAPQFNFTYLNILNKIKDPNAHVSGYRAKESWDVRKAYVQVSKIMNFVLQTRNFVLNTRDCVLTTRSVVLKRANFAGYAGDVRGQTGLKYDQTDQAKGQDLAASQSGCGPVGTRLVRCG